MDIIHVYNNYVKNKRRGEVDAFQNIPTPLNTMRLHKSTIAPFINMD